MHSAIFNRQIIYTKSKYCISFWLVEIKALTLHINRLINTTKQDENIINSNYEIKNMLIKPNGNEGHSIYIEIEIGISCMAYGTSDIELIQDMYSIEEDIDFSTKCIEAQRDKKNKKDKLLLTLFFSI